MGVSIRPYHSEGLLIGSDTMTLSQYLGRGAVSRGRTTINSNLNMVVSTVPYLHDPNDVAAVIKGIENLQAALSNVKNLTWVDPPPGTSASDYVNNVSLHAHNQPPSNHHHG
jgi:cellobiose dehydrogenase (acceptor)